MTGERRGGLAAYASLMRDGVTRNLALTAVAARLPMSMLVVVILLAVSRHWSYALASFTVGAYGLGLAVGAPVRGRIADRVGIGRTVSRFFVAFTVSFATVIALAEASRGRLLVPLFGLVTGLVMPPAAPVTRALWAKATRTATERHSAFALDAVLGDLGYVIGPPVAAGIASAVSPVAAAVVVEVVLAAGVFMIARAADRLGIRPDPTAAVGAGLWRIWGMLAVPELRRSFGIALFVTTAPAAAEVAIIVYASEHGARWLAGPLLAGVAVGSIVGGIVYGAYVDAGRAVSVRLSWMTAVLTVCLLLLAVATVHPVAFAVAAAASGVAIAPCVAALTTAVVETTPEGAGTEAQSWLGTAIAGGSAVGPALAGLVADSPLRILLLAAAAACVAMLGAVRVATAHRRSPRPVTPGRQQPDPQQEQARWEAT